MQRAVHGPDQLGGQALRLERPGDGLAERPGDLGARCEQEHAARLVHERRGEGDAMPAELAHVLRDREPGGLVEAARAGKSDAAWPSAPSSSMMRSKRGSSPPLTPKKARTCCSYTLAATVGSVTPGGTACTLRGGAGSRASHSRESGVPQLQLANTCTSRQGKSDAASASNTRSVVSAPQVAREAPALGDRAAAGVAGEGGGALHERGAVAEDQRLGVTRAAPGAVHAVAMILSPVRAESSCTTTPSIGSTSSSQGARSIMRSVSAKPASQRVRMPAGVKSMSFR